MSDLLKYISLLSDLLKSTLVWCLIYSSTAAIAYEGVMIRISEIDPIATLVQAENSRIASPTNSAAALQAATCPICQQGHKTFWGEQSKLAAMASPSRPLVEAKFVFMQAKQACRLAYPGLLQASDPRPKFSICSDDIVAILFLRQQ